MIVDNYLQNSKRWSTSTKIIVAAFLSLLAIALLYAFRVMIQPTIIALLLTFVLYQPVSWIQQRTGWSRATSIVAIYLFVILLLIIAPVIFVPRVVTSLESLVVVLETLVTDLQTAEPEPLLAIGGFELSANNLLQQLGIVIQDVLSPAAASALGLAVTVTTGVLTAIYVLVLGFWLLKDIIKLQRMVMNSLPLDYQEDILRLVQELGQIWVAFLRGQLVLGLVIGLITWIIMSIVGLPNAAGLALLAAVMEFLPTVGPGISGAIGTLVALLQGSTWMPIGNVPFALLVMAFYIVITQLESVYLIPRLVGRRVRLHPAITFTGIISAALVFGMLGVLLITPTIASTRVLLRYIFRKLQDLEPFESPYKHSDVRIPGLVAGHRIEGIVFDLDGTLTHLDWSLASDLAQRFDPLERIWPFKRRELFFRRLMAWMEGPSYTIVSILTWLKLHEDVRRLTVPLHRLRGFPSVESLKLRADVPELLLNLRPKQDPRPNENAAQDPPLQTDTQPLISLPSQQYKLGLITTRSRDEVHTFFQRADLPIALFDAISTRDDLRNPTPNNEAMARTLEILDLPADACLVVGDTELQLRAGEALGAVQIGVLCGMGTAQTFNNADLILDSPTDLTAYL